MIDSGADILRKCLVDIGVGVLGGTLGNWPIFADGEPSTPDNVITLTDTQGKSSGRRMTDGQMLQALGVQIRIRATTFPVGWTKANAIRDALTITDGGINEIYNRSVMVNSRNYLIHCCSDVGDVIRLGRAQPENRLSLFTLNLLVTITAGT